MSSNTRRDLPVIVSGIKAKKIRIKIRFFILIRVASIYKNPIVIIQKLKDIIKLRRDVLGGHKTLKFIKSGKTYYWSPENFGFPSSRFETMLRNEIYRIDDQIKPKDYSIPLHTVIWGITNRCSLKCKHCYDWKNIEDYDTLGTEKLHQILDILQKQGIQHIQLSGGEPLLRFNDLIDIIRKASNNTDFWILTSGFGLNEKKARELKQAGLCGVNISIDHWDEQKHNDFRQNQHSYHWVLKAVENCRKEGLLVSLSLCATKEFVTKINLDSYGHLAKDIGVHYIRILEPRAVGHFSKQDVDLSNDQLDMIYQFVLKMNSNPDFKEFPIVTFFGYHQRKIGCMGAGNRYLYIDSNGEIHACPFCQGSAGNVLETPFNDAITSLKNRGCHFGPGSAKSLFS